MSGIIKFLFLSLGLTAIVMLLLKYFPEALNNDENKISLITTITLLALFIFRIANSNINIGTILKQILGWILIIFIVLAGYSYKIELKQFSNRILANLLPGYGQVDDNQSMVFYSDSNGHFTITATLNDLADINFLLDTGASTVSLTTEDAKSLGINVDSLTYNLPFSTANGISWGAKATIDKIQIGSITAYNIPASISQEGTLSTSLLGMSFLNRLSRFQVQDNKLTLTK